MKVVDEHDQRAFRNEQKRHRQAIERLVKSIGEAAGYLTRDGANVNRARVQAERIRRDVLDLLERYAAVESLDQLAYIVEENADAT